MIKNPEISSNYLNSNAVNSTEKMKSQVYRPAISPNLICSNKSLVADEVSDFEDRCVKNVRQ